MIQHCNLTTVKAGLFKSELKNLEYLRLDTSNIELIEPAAFQYLIKLKWISLHWNEIRALSHRLFENNPDLIYIDLRRNYINSIQPKFFDGLSKLKLVDFESWNYCIQIKIGCETCLINQADLQNKLQKCFDNYCKSNDAICHTNSLANEINEGDNKDKEFKSIVEELAAIQKKLNALLMAD
jgi:Leucine-rich repeat (LRR) protein